MNPKPLEAKIKVWDIGIWKPRGRWAWRLALPQNVVIENTLGCFTSAKDARCAALRTMEWLNLVERKENDG